MCNYFIDDKESDFVSYHRHRLDQIERPSSSRCGMDEAASLNQLAIL